MRELTLQERAHTQILDLILNGDIGPGIALREQHVAQKLNMSPTPVREAFRKLEREGLLEFIPRCGVRVRNLTKDDIIDLYAIREGLEIAAIDLAVERATDKDWESIKNTVDIYKKECDALFRHLTSDERVPGPFRSDVEFHLSLITATHSQKFYEIAKSTNQQILFVTVHLGERYSMNYKELIGSAHEHADIYNAMHSKQIRLAEELLRAHLSAGRNRLITLMENAK